MRVLVITSSWPVCDRMLSGTFVRDLLRGLTGHGWTFEVVTPAPAGDRLPAAPEAGIHVHRVPHPGARLAGGLAHGRGMPETLADAPWMWAMVPPMLDTLAHAADAQARSGRFDLVWSHWLLPAGWIGAGVARRAGLPHHVTAHGSDIHHVERLAALPALRTAMAHAWRATTITATSQRSAARVARALGGRPVRVCPLPAGTGEARPADGPPSLLFLGRFEPIKGPDLLLEAGAQLPRAQVADLTLAGEGSLEESLRERARHVIHPVTFPGVLGGADKVAALERAHALVVPSRRMPDGRADGLPHAALEALSVGTPVIAPDQGPLGDLLRSTGAGLLYRAEGGERSRAARLAETLRTVAAEPARLAECRRRARESGRAFHPPVALAAWRRSLRECQA
jgi:glycosyltransferase involved in cell wall biosynthesis